MFFYILMEGLGLGFVMSAIVGPIWILCMRRSITQGFLAGFFTGLGAATADLVFASVAAFGIKVISSFLLGKAFILGILGGLYLTYLGYKTFKLKPCKKPAETKKGKTDLLYDFISTFFMTIINPMTILLFLITFTALSVGPSSLPLGVGLVSGIFVGAAAWWTILSFLGSILKNKIGSANKLIWINRISGMSIAIFGVAAILRSIIKMLYS